jgi:hypothetical protein
MTAFFVPHVLVAITLAASISGRPWAFALPTWVFLGSIVIDQLFAAGDRGRPRPARLLFGVVYLFTSTSRDVTHLTQMLPPLDERDERE